MRLFVFGFGYSARAVLQRMRLRLDMAWGTTRDLGKFAEIQKSRVTPLLFEAHARSPSPPCGERVAPKGLGEGSVELGIDDPSPSPSPQGGGELLSALAQADHVLVSIAPDENGDPALGEFREALAAARPKAVVYLSTVGVYGDHDGAWVDETSDCRPVSARSRQRVEAEAAWQSFAAETGVPVAIIRLAGIYGPGRGPFEKIRRGTARRVIKPGQVFNRIHVDDIAAIVGAALLQRADGIFNGSDDEPAPPQDVLAYAATLLGVPPPPEVAYESAALSPMARSFYGENKRVRSDRIKDTLGVALAYPTFREGLAATLRDEQMGNGDSSST